MMDLDTGSFNLDHNTLKADRGPAHKELDRLCGHWMVVGHNMDASDMVEGVESYEWFDGEYFLVNRWDRPSTKGKFKGMGWIGFDAESRKYRSYSISDSGYFRLYEVEVQPGSVRFEGERERGQIDIGQDGHSLAIAWEVQQEGKWTQLCRLRGTRLQ